MNEEEKKKKIEELKKEIEDLLGTKYYRIEIEDEGDEEEGEAPVYKVYVADGTITVSFLVSKEDGIYDMEIEDYDIDEEGLLELIEEYFKVTDDVEIVGYEDELK